MPLLGTAKIRDGEFEKFEEQGIELAESTIEDIKVRLCFVPDLTRGQQIQQIRQDASSVSGLSTFLKKSVPSVDYTMSLGIGESVLKVDGQTREGASEILFEQDRDRLSISTMILDALIAAPLDTRKELARNIVIVGGTASQLGKLAINI